MEGALNDIRLNGQLIANLYARNLVDIANSSVAPSPARTGIKYLGNNSRNITVLVSNKQHTFLPEDHLAFLTKILGACKLNTGDVAIVNTMNSNAHQAIQELTPAKVISFGYDLDMPVFEVLHKNGITYLAAAPLEVLTEENEEAKLMKTKLWVCLKQLFGI